MKSALQDKERKEEEEETTSQEARPLLTILEECGRAVTRVHRSYRTKSWVLASVHLKEKQISRPVDTWKEICDEQSEGRRRNKYAPDEAVLERTFGLVKVFLRRIEAEKATARVTAKLSTFLHVNLRMVSQASLSCARGGGRRRPAQLCPALPCSALLCPALPCSVLLCPALPSSALFCLKDIVRAICNCFV